MFKFSLGLMLHYITFDRKGNVFLLLHFLSLFYRVQRQVLVFHGSSLYATEKHYTIRKVSRKLHNACLTMTAFLFFR